MRLKDFEQIIHIKSEIAVLSKRLSKANNSSLVSDYAKDYKTGYERIITITGYEIADSDKIRKIRDTLERRKAKLEAKLLEAELYIDSIADSKIRTLMTLRYLEGKSWDDTAKAHYKNLRANSAQMTVKRYFEKL